MICKRCVMDSSAVDFKETITGCNYCDEFEERYPRLASQQRFREKEVESNLNQLKSEILSMKTSSEYDCLIGVSGGLDSCYALHLICELGLKPLVVHMDNGWNSSLAQNNIEGIIKKHNLDLRTRVLRWSEYKRMQIAFFKSDVIDVELLYDHAAIATCFMFSKQFGIDAIIAGTNLSTEGFRMPPEWAWINKMDTLNIKDIWLKNGDGTPIADYPFYSNLDYISDVTFGNKKWISVLDRINYIKSDAEKVLIEEYGFVPYKYKHYESIFTRFYQGYILPEKFGVDKRKNHFSTLIMTGVMSRDTALIELQKNPYGSKHELDLDLEYFLKKIGWNYEDLSEYINRKPASHWKYKSEEKYLKYLRIIDSALFIATRLISKIKGNKKLIKFDQAPGEKSKSYRQKIGKILINFINRK